MYHWLLTHGAPRLLVYVLNAIAYTVLSIIMIGLGIVVIFWPGLLIMTLWQNDQAAAIATLIWWVGAVLFMAVWGEAVKEVDEEFPQRKPKDRPTDAGEPR